MLTSDIVLRRGFQLQHGKNNNVPTVQGTLERALCKIKQESRDTLRMQCSGRTDSGVHAKGQVPMLSATNFRITMCTTPHVVCHARLLCYCTMPI